MSSKDAVYDFIGGIPDRFGEVGFAGDVAVGLLYL
jgi:hypothetical protein